jgi:RNA polymerase sigma-70 factor (ECF subfamily)
MDVEERITKALDVGDPHGAATAGLGAYGPQIHAYLGGVLGDRDLADDAFSDFAERLWRGLPKFRREASFKTWAYQIAWSAAQDRLRDPFRRRARPLDEASISKLVQSLRSATPMHVKTETKYRFDELKRHLDHHDRALLLLRVEQNMSWRDVAIALADDGAAPLSEASVRKRFERLKGRLRELAGNPA